MLKKAASSLSAVIQRCQVHGIFVFYPLYCNPKEKYHIKRKLNSKKKNILRKINIIIILICQHLESVGLVQQKIKLPLPYFCLFIVLDYDFAQVILTVLNLHLCSFIGCF